MWTTSKGAWTRRKLLMQRLTRSKKRSNEKKMYLMSLVTEVRMVCHRGVCCNRSNVPKPKISGCKLVFLFVNCECSESFIWTLPAQQRSTPRVMLSYEALECSHQHKKTTRENTPFREETQRIVIKTLVHRSGQCARARERLYCVFERPNTLSTHFLLNSCLIYLFYFCLSLSFFFLSSAVINVVSFAAAAIAH